VAGITNEDGDFGMNEKEVIESLKKELSRNHCVKILQDGAPEADVSPTAYAMFELLCNSNVRCDKQHWNSFLQEALDECILINEMTKTPE